MDSKFTWVPLYEELAQALLRYKEDRTELVEWIYEDLGKVTRADGQSLVAYLKQKDGSRIIDIDPFSVFAIFNRSTSWENRTKLLTHFKKKFRLTSTTPSDFNGIPTVDARRSFFFSWKSDNSKVIHDLWQLFEKVISDHDISEAFDQVLENGMPKYSLTMCLFWICPEKYLALDSRNRSYLESFGFPNEFPKFNYDEYSNLLAKVQKKINNGDIPCSSFLELSLFAWKTATTTPNVWLVGYTFSDSSQFDRFVENSIWEGHFNDNSTNDQKLLTLATTIKKGDILILKSTSTKGAKHDQPFLRVKAVAVVLSDVNSSKNDGYTSCVCNVQYYGIKDSDFDNPVLASYRKTIHLADDKAKPLVDYANSLINPTHMPQLKYKEYIDLLTEAHNLVFTGAPGTGKTHMAQAIAEEMGAVTKFVQFHPSYDYTDFVEGLRPIEKGDGQLGFERKDGVFKEFCREAIKNLIDSEKSIESLTKEMSWQEKLDRFVEDSIEEGTKFKTVNGSEFIISEIKNHSIVIHNEQNEKTTQVAVNADEILVYCNI